METVGDNDLPKNGDVAKSPFQTVVAVVPSAARGAVRERADDPIRLRDGEPGDHPDMRNCYRGKRTGTRGPRPVCDSDSVSL